jgi:hypothetical protein
MPYKTDPKSVFPPGRTNAAFKPGRKTELYTRIPP